MNMKAKLFAMDTVSGLKDHGFQYNPKSLDLKRGSAFKNRDSSGGSSPFGAIEYGCPTADSLSIDFVMDSTRVLGGGCQVGPLMTMGGDLAASAIEAVASVLPVVPMSGPISTAAEMIHPGSIIDPLANLHKFTMPAYDKTLKQKRAPFCCFVWGQFKFYGGVDSISAKITLFDFKGRPQRAEVSMSFLGIAALDKKWAPTSVEKLAGVGWSATDLDALTPQGIMGKMKLGAFLTVIDALTG